jgi:hypothetical protein
VTSLTRRLVIVAFFADIAALLFIVVGAVYVFLSQESGTSFTLLEINTACRFDPPLGSIGRFLLYLMTVALPFLLVGQVMRLRKVRAGGPPPAPNALRRYAGPALLVLALASGVAVAWSDLVLLPPYVQSLTDRPLSPWVRSMMLHDALWWIGYSLVVLLMAASYSAVGTRKWASRASYRENTEQGGV